MKLKWRPMALEDRIAIQDYIAQDNPIAAIELDMDFEDRAEKARQRPTLYPLSKRMPGKREIVVRPNYVMIYHFDETTLEILRVVHAAQKWPTKE
jgi:toxin ParE1/3/4